MKTLSVKDLSDTIGAIHEAGADSSLWPFALDQLCNLFSSDAVVISLRAGSFAGCRDHVVNEQYRAMVNDYASYYGRFDLLRQVVVRAPVGTILTTRMVVPSSQLVRSEFYREFMARHGLEDGMETQIISDAEFRAGAAVLRSPRFGAFERQDMELMTLLLPHLRRAIRTQMRLGRLEVAHDCALEALDRLSQGVLIVDAQSRVIYANDAAEAILRAGNGLGVEPTGDRRLCAANHRQTPALRRMVAQAAGCDHAMTSSGAGGSNGALRLDRADGEPIFLCAAPLRAETPWNMAHRPAAILLVGAPENAAKSLPTALQRFYGLTPAEAATAGAIAQGQGVEDAAGALGVAPSTVRWHLQRIYQKTGIARQAELARLVERLGTIAGNDRVWAHGARQLIAERRAAMSPGPWLACTDCRCQS